MSAVYKNRGGGRSQNRQIRWNLAIPCLFYMRTGEEGRVITHLCGRTWQDNVSCIQEHEKREESEHTVSTLLGKTISAVYKNRGWGRSLYIPMRQYLARQCQLYTRTGEEGGIRPHWCGITLQDNVSCIQELGSRNECERTDAVALGKAMSAVYRNRKVGRSLYTPMRQYLAR